jgi:hypothetical protein
MKQKEKAAKIEMFAIAPSTRNSTNVSIGA